MAHDSPSIGSDCYYGHFFYCEKTLMITFALTGGIACGKSTVTKTFRKHGIPIVDADIVARQVVEPGTYGYFLVLAAFGPDFFNEDTTLNRSKLADLVFTDKASMDKLNHIMAPIIYQESGWQMGRWLNYLRDQNRSLICGYDAALIFEQNDTRFSPMIVVSCSQETQLARLMKRNSLTQEEAMARISAQMPLEEKVKLADFVINTNGSIEDNIFQTETIIKHLQATCMNS